MTNRGRALHITASLVLVVLVLWVYSVTCPAWSHETPKDPPPKTMWQARSSGDEGPQYPAANAIDGSMDTRWSSLFSDSNWLEIDLIHLSVLCGVTIHWETAYASEYAVLTSMGGNDWQEVYTTTSGTGEREDIYFEPVIARYLRVVGIKRATNWGYSIWEINIYGPSQRALVYAPSANGTTASELMNGKTDSAWVSQLPPPLSILIDLQRITSLGGLRIAWGEHHATSVQLNLSIDGVMWNSVATLQQGTGKFDVLLHAPHDARFIRLDLVSGNEGSQVEIREITLLCPAHAETPLALYKIAAEKAPPGFYPESLHGRQVYWTTVGLPGDHQESLLDEYGNIEPFSRGPVIMPFIQDEINLWSALNADSVEQSLEDGFLPLPKVSWVLGHLKLDIQALSHGERDVNSATYVRYRLSNLSPSLVAGTFFLVLRPLQINPSWQHGGLSPIKTLTQEKLGAWNVLSVDGNPIMVSLKPENAVGIRKFSHGDIIEDIRHGSELVGTSLSDARGMLSGTFAYSYVIKPWGYEDIIVSFPLHGRLDDLAAFLDGYKGMPVAFNAAMQQAKRFWLDTINRVVFELPDAAVTNTVKSQLAYIMINREGSAIQPGPRNYERSWIRDGAITCSALLRMGMFKEVREYIDWYAKAVYPDGMVPPILNTNGTPYIGFGSNLEYDSQGQFIYVIMEYFRVTRDTKYLASLFTTIKGAMGFMVKLREHSMTSEYLEDKSESNCFSGLFGPSISHEGYADPVHSYWDDFWGLRGWKDGRDAARILGHDEIAAWADNQYRQLKTSVVKSIAATMAYWGVDYVPGCAEKGDFDPASTAIAFFPCEESDVLPRLALSNTFGRYLNELASRRFSWDGAFSPYELRITSALLDLQQPKAANEVLDFVLSNRRPLAWNVFSEVIASDRRKGSYFGDMPHTWVGAEFICSVRNMVVRETGDTLELLAGVRRAWVSKGEGIRVENLPTHFGRLSMHVYEEANRLTVVLKANFNIPVRMRIVWPREEAPNRVTVDGEDWDKFDARSIDVPSNVSLIEAWW